MANELGPTELAALIPENWRPRYLNAFYEKQYVLPYALNTTGDFKKGDIAHITVEQSLTTNAIASDGSLTVQTTTPSDVQVVVGTNRDVTVEITGIAKEQAFDEFENRFPAAAGDAMRQKMELDLLAEQSNFTTLTAQGDGSGNLSEDEYLGAIQQFVTAKIPVIQNPEDCYFALPDNQFAPAKKQGFLDYNRTGESGKGGASTIKLPSLWNIPVVFSTQVASSAGIRYGLLLHSTALAWAAQRNVVPRMADRLAAAKDSYLMTVIGTYGVKTVVAGRGVRLLSKA